VPGRPAARQPAGALRALGDEKGDAVIAEVAADVEQNGCDSMPDHNPANELVPFGPPQMRGGDVAVGPNHSITGVGDQSFHVRPPGARRRPR
jgi:hypothetical protein